MVFEFSTAECIIFGKGAFKQVGDLVAGMGSRAFVVAGRSARGAESLLQKLKEKGMDSEAYGIAHEPTLTILQEALAAARHFKPHVVIGLGGGSVMDSAKAIAALIHNKGPVQQYLEVIGKGRPIENPPIPCVAIPTTAGTGAEVTRNAVLTSEEHKVKVSLRSPKMFPKLALVDPDLTVPMPPALTASTGMDALAQLLESWVSKKANPITDGLCMEGIRRASRSLLKAYRDGSHMDARSDMSLASLISGMTLTNAGLGAVHGIAGPLGGLCAVPHGVACAMLLPFVMEANIRALKKSGPESPVLSKILKASKMMTGSDSAHAEDAIQWLMNLCRDLNIPPLSQYGLEARHIPTLAAQSLKASSMKGNPVELSLEEIQKIIEKALTWSSS